MKKIVVNEFEKLVRVTGMTKRRFSEVTGLKGSSINKYIKNPTMLRLKHLNLLSESEELKSQDVGNVELLNIISQDDNIQRADIKKCSM